MKVAIVIGSTREGRASEVVAKWVTAEASKLTKATVDVLDLRDYAMPFFDEVMPPQFSENRTLHPEVKKWLETLAKYDTFVFVTPEYNHSMPAVLKNAIDYVDFQLKEKRALIVGHGPSGGASDAMSHLRTVLTSSIGMEVVEPGVSLKTMVAMGGVFDEPGTLLQSDNTWEDDLKTGLETLFK